MSIVFKNHTLEETASYTVNFGDNIEINRYNIGVKKLTSNVNLAFKEMQKSYPCDYELRISDGKTIITWPFSDNCLISSDGDLFMVDIDNDFTSMKKIVVKTIKSLDERPGIDAAMVEKWSCDLSRFYLNSRRLRQREQKKRHSA